MSTSAQGSVVDDNGTGLAGLGVQLEDLSRVLVVSLGGTVTDAGGKFSLSYAADLPTSDQPGEQPRQLRLRILLGQHVLHEATQADTADATLAFPAITLKPAETSSWWATLGSGAPSRVTQGNAIRWLVDNRDAWTRCETVIDNARTLDVMQLQIDVDDDYEHDITAESPRIVLSFDAQRNPLDDLTHGLDNADLRIERSMLKAVQRNVDLRVQIPRMTLDPHGVTVIGAVLGLGAVVVLGATVWALIALIGLIVAARLAAWLYVDRKVLSNMFGKRELQAWYDKALLDIGTLAPTPQLGTVRIGELRLRSNFVTHAKMLIDRDVEGVLLGSPFEQVYFDSQHRFDDARRGLNASKGPIHDVSVGLRGPALGHLQEVFNLHWNIAVPGDELPVTPALPAAPASLNDGELSASVQVVRTLDSMFTTAAGTDGEKGILEAYLRAIHLAERFIYIENQYFNNEAITQALIDALAAKPALQVLLLLNAAPDMPFYMGWQQKAIQRITVSLGDAGAAAKRLGVFSTWTHESTATGAEATSIVDNYLHTKTALVDNRWATVGSANLDGASLDFVQYARPLLDGEIRNTETNVVVFEEEDVAVSAVDGLRRRLWAEHLGYELPNGEPDVAHADLADAPGKDWLAAWRARSDPKRDALILSLDNVSPCRVLEWPSTSFQESLGIWRLLKLHKSHSTARAYLQSLLSLASLPEDVVEDDGPPGTRFFYGANASPGA